jgi:DNA-binding NtrC family response regulator
LAWQYGLLELSYGDVLRGRRVDVLDILVVDDEASSRMGVSLVLGDAGYRVTEASDGTEALKLVGERVFDLVISDVRLPTLDGLSLMRLLREASPSTVVILMTAFAHVAEAVTALREGALDYVTKPFDPERFPLPMVKEIAERLAVASQLSEARAQLGGGLGAPIIGRSPAMTRLLARIDTLALSDAPVLISGETGTGKELVAHALHLRGARARRPFVAINCAALPDALLEAELFGHERGAFTGAVKKRDGRFKLADSGTLLLDEVAEMSLPAQTKLLRVLQEGTIEPVGSNTSVHVDVRIVSATHQNLKQRVADGRFREDLYYRLNVLDLSIPPLRERRGDLALLFEHFLRQLSPAGRPAPRISTRAWHKLEAYSFPGNVRELAHVVERALVLSRGGDIDLEHLPSDVSGQTLVALALAPTGELQPLAAAAKEFERQHLLQALNLTGGRRADAAQLLGISRKNLWEKLRAHGITDSELDESTELTTTLRD